MLAGRFIVYALTDPRDGAIRYVGKSSSGMRRPREHTWDYSETHKARWIRALRRAGLTYGIGVLEACERAEDLEEAERRWIAEGRRRGWPLTNLTEGGEGAPGAIVTAAARAKRSASARAAWASPEKRARIVAAQRAAAATPAARARLGRAVAHRKWTDAERAAVSEGQRKAWADPAIRARRLAALRARLS